MLEQSAVVFVPLFCLPYGLVLIETDSTSDESSNVVVSQLSNYHMGSDGASSFIYNSDTAPIESI